MPAARRLPAARMHNPGARIAKLVNDRYGGNIRTAAREVGVGYHALWRTVTRRNTEPSMGLVTRVAAHFGVTTDAILTGEAAATDVPDPQATSD